MHNSVDDMGNVTKGVEVYRRQ